MLSMYEMSHTLNLIWGIFKDDLNQEFKRRIHGVASG
jgi:hypothetical protein